MNAIYFMGKVIKALKGQIVLLQSQLFQDKTDYLMLLDNLAKGFSFTCTNMQIHLGSQPTLFLINAKYTEKDSACN